MSKQIKTSTGKIITLLNPAEKGEKFAKELKRGYKFTNDGIPKRDNDKNALKLTSTEASYRSGYLDARKDSAKCYKAKHK